MDNFGSPSQGTVQDESQHTVGSSCGGVRAPSRALISSKIGVSSSSVKFIAPWFLSTKPAILKAK